MNGTKSDIKVNFTFIVKGQCREIFDFGLRRMFMIDIKAKYFLQLFIESVHNVYKCFSCVGISHHILSVQSVIHSSHCSLFI